MALPISGLQYLATPGLDTTFSGMTLNLGANVVTGHTIGVRYRYEYDDPAYVGDPPAPRIVTYPPWWLNSQTLTITAVTGSPSPRQVFTTNTGNELYTATPGGPYSITYENAGITDGTEYSYIMAFNETNLKYIPRLSPASQSDIDVGPTGFPSTPYDASNNIYPIDTVTACSPDGRDVINVYYTLTTNYRLAEDEDSLEYTESQVITHPLLNGLDDSNLLETLLSQSYYTHGIYSIGLWDVSEPPLYSEDGTPIAPIPRYNSENGETYNQLTNGEGFNG